MPGTIIQLFGSAKFYQLYFSGIFVVYDMIAVAKGREDKYANDLYLRYLQKDKVQACEEVEATNFDEMTEELAGMEVVHLEGDFPLIHTS